MWNGQIDAIIEELFILVVPTSQVAYNEEKEEKAQLETKRAELERVEKRKQLADIKRNYFCLLKTQSCIFLRIQWRSLHKR